MGWGSVNNSPGLKDRDILLLGQFLLNATMKSSINIPVNVQYIYDPLGWNFKLYNISFVCCVLNFTTRLPGWASRAIRARKGISRWAGR